MMDTIDTSHIDLRSYITTPLKKVANTRGGEYHGICPFCGGTDRFVFWEQDNRWSCRHCVGSDLTPKDVIDFVMRRDNLKFMEAVAKLGIKSPNGTTERHTTKRAYRSAQDYAAEHGLDMEDLERAGWAETTHQNRPALTFKTKGGVRFRFLDGQEPRWKSQEGFKSSWYGLDDKVIANAKKEHAPLVLCNGEISTLAARFWGVPAICVSGGGERPIPSELMAEIGQKWQGRIAIVMDCDEHGRKAAETIAKQLGDKGVVINLDLAEGQDLADFVKLWGGGSLKELKRRIPLPPQTAITHREAAQRTIERLDERNVIDGKPIVIPFKSWHTLGGYAKIGYPSKLTCFVGMSGHGKTSILNMTIDALLKRGEIGVGLMPEFDGDEYHWDRLQRYSGFGDMPLITAQMMMEWELWKKEVQMGIPESARMGRALTGKEKAVVKRISEMVDSEWSGIFELFPFQSSLENALTDMGSSIQERRSQGQIVSFAAFDYLQILRATGYDDTDNAYEHVLGLIKQFVMQHKIHGFVTSQVNKVADKGARDNNRMLGATDMRFVRDDKINLLVTLNVVYDDTGNKQMVAGTKYGAAYANIVKNTKGQTGKIPMMTDFEHLRWLDSQWQSKSIDLSDL